MGMLLRPTIMIAARQSSFIAASQRIFLLRNFSANASDQLSNHLFTMRVPSISANSKSMKKESVTFVEWEKEVGDTVEEEETIAIIETDKVAFEVPSEVSGILRRQYVQEDDIVEPGDLLADIEIL